MDSLVTQLIKTYDIRISSQTISQKMFDDDTTFIPEEVTKIIKENIESIMANNTYLADKVNQWSTMLSEAILTGLSKLKKPFKYVVTCSIIQKVGAGLHTAASCYWDSVSDGTCTVRWENKSMYCVVSVFGLAI